MPTYPNQSLLIGIQILQCIAAAEKSMGVREMARQLDVTPTRVSRIAGTLAALGLVRQDRKRRYGPGPALHLWAAWALRSAGLLPAALPVLQQLYAEGLTVALGVRWQDRVCFLVQERPGRTLAEGLFAHRITRVECSSLGIALAAAAGEVPPRNPQFGPNQQIDAAGLAVEFQRVRDSGYAMLRFSNGETSVGCPIPDDGPPWVGLAVSGLRLGAEYLPDLAELLIQKAREVGERLGKQP